MIAAEAIAWANKIDSRVGPISGADADRLARFLRRVAQKFESIACAADHKPGGRTIDEVMRDFDAIHYIAARS